LVFLSVGPAIVLNNRQIRQMLRLAKVSKKDIFYDLGCGYGQLCIIAAQEFKVKLAIGIEKRKDRVRKARQEIRRLGLQKKVKIRHQAIEDVDLTDVTIVYDGLSEEEDNLKFYEKSLPKGCRLIIPFLPLVSVIPNRHDYPFYLMQYPFKKTDNGNKWASSILFFEATIDDLLKEVKEDLDWSTDIRTLKKLIKIRFKKGERL